MIDFDPIEHRYTHRGVPYISATQLVNLVKNKFNTKSEAIRMAEQHGHTPEYWLRRWDTKREQSADIGSRLHARIEDIDLSRGIIKQGERMLRVLNPELITSTGTPDYWYWPPGVYPELLLAHHGYRIAGRADRVILGVPRGNGTRVADIDDHKTNERIRERSWVEPDGSRRMLQAPLDDLMDCELIHYQLQLSIYQFMLEEMGFVPGVRRILHYAPLPYGMGEPGERNKKPRIIETPYLRDSVIKLIQYAQKNKVY